MGKKIKTTNRIPTADEIAGKGDFSRKGAYINYVREKLKSNPDFMHTLLYARAILQESRRENLAGIWAKAEKRLQKNNKVSMFSLVLALPYGWGNRQVTAIATHKKKTSIGALSFLDKALSQKFFQTVGKREPISAILEKVLLSSYSAGVKSKALSVISMHDLVECVPAIKKMLSEKTIVSQRVEILAKKLLRKLA